MNHILSASPTLPSRVIGSGMDRLLKKEELFLGCLGRRACSFLFGSEAKEVIAVATMLVPSCYHVEPKNEINIDESKINKQREMKF